MARTESRRRTSGPFLAMRLGDMRKAIVIAALVLCPLAARAQFTLTSPQAITTTASTVPQIYVGRFNCPNEQLTFNWDLTALGGIQVGQTVNIVKTNSSSNCNLTTAPTDPGSSSNAAPTQTTTGSDTVSAESMILDQDAGMPGGCDNTTTSAANPYKVFYCVQVSTASTINTNATATSANIQINFSTGQPTTPTTPTVEAGDQHLKVFWTAGNSGEPILSYQVHVLPAIDGGVIDGSKGTKITAPQVDADVSQDDNGDKLQDDVHYNVLVVATDVYNNVSEPTPATDGVPLHVLDFYGLYRTDNGRAGGGGGCESPGPSTWIAAVALLAALLARRKKRARNGALFIAALAAFTPKARAESYERPPRFLLVALKVDRYDPKIDSEAGLTSNPYHQIFGPRAPLRWQLEVDWEAWHPYGTVLLGITGGYWQNFGKGLVSDTRARSQDTALLDIIPIGLVATYRFDKLADLWPRFPLIPYAQAGVMRALWASFNGVGNVSPDSSGRGGNGSGWTWGYTTALGFAIALDAIDPDLSREAFTDTGIQRSSIFAEYGWTRLDGFHNNSSLILSDRAWRFGVAMEF